MEKVTIKCRGIAWLLAGVLAVGPVLQVVQAQPFPDPGRFVTVGSNTGYDVKSKGYAGGDYGKPGKPSEPREPRNPRKHHGGGGSSALPAVLAGVAALVVISQLLAKESEQPAATPDEQGDTSPDLLDRLSQEGPEFATAFNMSAFMIRGPVRGEWPLVIDYEHNSSGRVQLQVSARGAAHVYDYLLPRLGPGRHIIQFKLHPDLGPQLRPAIIAVTARDGEQTLSGFRVYGLGVGPEAVGSVAIDQLQFRPPSIRVSRDEKAAYRFHSGSDFDSIAIEFLHLEQAGDGSRHSYVDRQFMDEGVRQDHWVGLNESREWDGRNQSDNTSVGTHRLQVRAWDADGDWVCAWSEPVVAVVD